MASVRGIGVAVIIKRCGSWLSSVILLRRARRCATPASGAPGLGFNHNLLLLRSTGFKVWHTALQGVADFGPQALVCPWGCTRLRATHLGIYHDTLHTLYLMLRAHD